MKKLLKFIFTLALFCCIFYGAYTLALRYDFIDKQVADTVSEHIPIIETKKEEPVRTYTLDDYETDISYYIFDKLSENEKSIYVAELVAMLNMDENVEVPTTDLDEAGKIFGYIMCEHPEIFYVEGSNYIYYDDNSKNIVLEPTYTMTKEEKEMYQSGIDTVCNEWLSQVEVDVNDYKKVKQVYEILINNVDYQPVENDQNIISTFMKKKTVCNGYASALVYMLQKLGIEAVRVEGYAGNESHSWTMVKEDGHYCWVDATWGNSLHNMSAEGEKYINYSYLNIEDINLYKTHKITSTFPIEKCDFRLYNYYVQEGLTAETVEEAKEKFKLLETQSVVSIQFSNQFIYNDAVNQLFDNNEIYDCFEWGNQVVLNYYTDNVTLTITVIKVE